MGEAQPAPALSPLQRGGIQWEIDPVTAACSMTAFWNADILTQLTFWTFQLLVGGPKKYEDDEDEDDEEVDDLFASQLLIFRFHCHCWIIFEAFERWRLKDWSHQPCLGKLFQDYTFTPWFTFLLGHRVWETLFLSTGTPDWKQYVFTWTNHANYIEV